MPEKNRETRDASDMGWKGWPVSFVEGGVSFIRTHIEHDDEGDVLYADYRQSGGPREIRVFND